MGRAALRRGRDEIGVLEETKALEALRLDRGTAWDIGRPDARWRAARRDGSGAC